VPLDRPPKVTKVHTGRVHTTVFVPGTSNPAVHGQGRTAYKGRTGRREQGSVRHHGVPGGICPALPAWSSNINVD